jgi:adenylate cyclase
VQFLLIALLAVMAFISVLRFNFIKSILAIIVLDILFFIAVSIAAANGYMTSFINPISVQFVTLIFGYSFKFISENRSKEKIKLAMGKYLSQDIMKNVVSNIDDLKLGGKRAIVTVLFSDIRGFTSLSEKMSAEEVSMILNEYFSEMEPIITKYNGVINKFIGDAVMAIFGEPIQDINHPQNAVKCAYEMLKKVEYLREKWLFEGKPKIEIGVGINTGEVFIGNIGTETRMEYTVIGDTVNLASRIESYNKVYKTNLLVSNSTYNYIADIADVIKISEVQIRGKAKKMNIYEVLRIDKNK